jgi:hypothetical protein
MVATRLPISTDPLIGEAKQRMRRRRTGLLLLLLAGTVALCLALWPSGAPVPARPSAQAPARDELARLTVPVDAYERKWRGWVAEDARTRPVRPAAATALLHHLERYALASGLRVVRLKVWRTTGAPSEELVVATTSAPAAYLKHNLTQFLSRTGTAGDFRYVKVVDRHGRSIFEAGSRPIENGGGVESMLRVPPALVGCNPEGMGPRVVRTCPAK